MAHEVNFDGLIGPSHNYGGLSDGNLASAANAGDIANPREAALQGLEKMRMLIAHGLVQGVLPPLPRPNFDLLVSAGFGGTDAQIIEGSVFSLEHVVRQCRNCLAFGRYERRPIASDDGELVDHAAPRA